MNLRTRISRLEQASQPKENSEQQAYPDECICYPKLRYGLSFKSGEMRAAKELPCPLHGNRIPNPHETVYLPKWVQDHETVCDWQITRPGQREQYEKSGEGKSSLLGGPQMSTIRKRLEDAEMVKAYRDFVQATGQLKDTHVTSCASFRYVVIPEGRDTHSRNSCEGA